VSVVQQEITAVGAEKDRVGLLTSHLVVVNEERI